MREYPERFDWRGWVTLCLMQLQENHAEFDVKPFAFPRIYSFLHFFTPTWSPPCSFHSITFSLSLSLSPSGSFSVEPAFWTLSFPASSTGLGSSLCRHFYCGESGQIHFFFQPFCLQPPEGVPTESVRLKFFTNYLVDSSNESRWTSISIFRRRASSSSFAGFFY